jgi:transcriptional regulator with XRE-family HTH domain
MSASPRPVDVSKWLRKLRAAHWPDTHVSQSQLSAGTGVSVVSIRAFEDRHTIPSEETLEKFARYFASRRCLELGLLPLDQLDEKETANYMILRGELEAARLRDLMSGW